MEHCWDDHMWRMVYDLNIIHGDEWVSTSFEWHVRSIYSKHSRVWLQKRCDCTCLHVCMSCQVKFSFKKTLCKHVFHSAFSWYGPWLQPGPPFSIQAGEFLIVLQKSFSIATSSPMPMLSERRRMTYPRLHPSMKLATYNDRRSGLRNSFIHLCLLDRNTHVIYCWGVANTLRMTTMCFQIAFSSIVLRPFLFSNPSI